MMIANVAVEAATAELDRSRNVAVPYESRAVHFKTDAALVKAWQTYVSKNPPPANLSERELELHLKQAADQILLNQGQAAGTGLFKSWYQKMESFLPAVAYQGIVCAGRAAADLRIANNSIHGVGQGIHIGLSHDKPEAAEPYMAGRIRISGNHIVTYSSAENFGGRHGIFVGNCDSLDIESNYIGNERFPKDLDLPLDAMQVKGHFGKMLQIRRNHTKNCETGVYARAADPIQGSHLWLIGDNMLEDAVEPAVDAQPAQHFLLQNNIA